ncbi:hypothetical protein ADEAN_000462500 [Angomonas deanei]|uniref:Uncharacterized protein n=1 Tax=Angomonas deanei TaxID=59799 RepID=A0A7G2CDW3_9TRYP|nr:hypothetical protein ADEAN_000462500 [Angomonas deanei]
MSPCPICDAPVADTELDCGACKNALPFCIVTGKHLLKNDFTLTPCCGFPAIYSSPHLPSAGQHELPDVRRKAGH